jgi:3-oxoacyl-[acyl-carrier protein] reductase
MQRQKWGRIIAITSITVKQPLDDLILSNVARLGVLGLAKTMASELARDGITVNTVCPGYTRTQRLEELAGKQAVEKNVSENDVYRQLASTIPMGRLGEPEELAAVVAFLASEKASYVTGTCVQVDGGFVRGIL